tara:strand:- start:1807 stop:1995 length:189 start_codon:yes stop_codon:yes gene_type:complete
MYVKHLIEDILDLQKVIPVTQEEKFTKDELEYMPEDSLKELKFQYQIINGSLSDTDIMNHLN